MSFKLTQQLNRIKAVLALQEMYIRVNTLTGDDKFYCEEDIYHMEEAVRKNSFIEGVCVDHEYYCYVMKATVFR